MSERLEDIERYISNVDKADVNERHKMLDYRHWAYELLKIAKEQAERVEEVERAALFTHNMQAERIAKLEKLQSSSKMHLHSTIHNLRIKLEGLERENKRYREALQAIIDFYEQKRQEYKDSIKEREKELTKGQLDEPDAYFVQQQLEMDRLTVGIVNGFIENLKKLESDEG